MSVRAISYGGGVQSTALCLLAIEGAIDYPLAIFANVGDRAENPATLDYLRSFIPWAAARGLEIVHRRWVDRLGRERDLYDDTVRADLKDVPIPAYMAGGAPGNRKCTDRYKIAVVGRDLRKRGACKANPAVVAVGISTDEHHRINKRHAQPWETPTYPLIDLNMSRGDCETLIRSHGLPVPPKSSCWFCPFRGAARWMHDRDHEPERFAAGVALEVAINVKRAAMGRDAVTLTPRYLLSELPAWVDLPEQLEMFNEGACDEGYCWT